MLDLLKVKAVLWDFDDTLCIHSIHSCSSDDEHLYNVGILKYGKDVYKGQPCSQLKEFMEICKDLQLHQGLISAVNSVKHGVAKLDWVKEKYDIELENYCVSSILFKLDMLYAIADALDLQYDEILIVDDYWETLERCANAGFQACNPMEIILYMEKEGK